MENILENKAKFFGQYFGVNCLRHEELPNISALPVMTPWHAGLETEYLELKPLSSISDEDLKAIEFKFPNGREGLNLKFYPDNYEYHWSVINTEGYLALKDFDYLRSRRYALPWMGLSVEHLIEYGWVKLQEPISSNN